MHFSDHDFHTKQNLLWLLEKTSNQGVLGTRLPSQEDVLVFLHHHKEQSETLPEEAKSSSLKLHEVWEKANLPVRRST